MVELAVPAGTFDELEVGDEVELDDGTVVTITAVNDEEAFGVDDEDEEYDFYYEDAEEETSESVLEKFDSIIEKLKKKS
jgi:hypothetical protein